MTIENDLSDRHIFEDFVEEMVIKIQRNLHRRPQIRPLFTVSVSE
jgi:hypothetical protein